MSRATKLNHVSVCTPDMAASIRFYADLFMTEEVPTPNFGFPVQWLRVGEQQLHLFQRPSDPPAYHHLALTVDELEGIYERAKELDCFDRRSFGHHFYELPGDCAQLYLRDPGGNLVEVNSPGAARLPERIRRDMKQLADVFPQSEENLRATLFL